MKIVRFLGLFPHLPRRSTSKCICLIMCTVRNASWAEVIPLAKMTHLLDQYVSY